MHLRYILRGAHAFLSPNATLAALPNDLALLKPVDSPHSVADIVAHMAFWQQWFLDRCDGLPIPPPPHAALGWPAVQSGEWNAVLARFEAGLARANALANDEERTARPLVPALETEFLAHYTTADALIHISLHNAHHLGQITTLRQQLGAWPPPSGSYTW
jgi:uncharacterized damage-inducible protein DinB